MGPDAELQLKRSSIIVMFTLLSTHAVHSRKP